MSAEIIVLPTVRVERPEKVEGEAVITLHLHPKDAARLKYQANHWNMTEAETAEFLLSNALDPKRLK